MKALVLSGGGAKGAYQVGVLRHLLADLHEQYEVVCGVSVGALNASFLAQYPIGNEVASYNDIRELWESLSTRSIYKKWNIFGELMAFFKKSVYNSEPLQHLVRSRLDVEAVRNSGKKLRVGAVELESGLYRSFAEDYSLLTEAILASASYPAMLCPIRLEGKLWTDGGVRNITPLREAIELGASDIHVVQCAPKDAMYAEKKIKNALTVAERAIDIMSDEIVDNDLRMTQLINEVIVIHKHFGKKRLINVKVIRPKEVLGDSLDFDQDALRPMFEKGYKDAIEQMRSDA